MADLVVIVPSRGRPHAVAEMVEAFAVTCETDPNLVFAVDESDPKRGEYAKPVMLGSESRSGVLRTVMNLSSTSMVEALNLAALGMLNRPMNALVGQPKAIAFMGDDHRPRTKGWDTAYLEALAAKPGLVYGNDLVQGESLPTQVAMSAELVRALGHMAPPTLTHLYVDNYWLALGRAADCITYLPDVVVEHLHPSAGTAPVDDGYVRVNSMAMFSRDETAMTKYWETHSARDIAAARSVAMVRG